MWIAGKFFGEECTAYEFRGRFQPSGSLQKFLLNRLDPAYTYITWHSFKVCLQLKWAAPELAGCSGFSEIIACKYSVYRAY